MQRSQEKRVHIRTSSVDLADPTDQLLRNVLGAIPGSVLQFVAGNGVGSFDPTCGRATIRIAVLPDAKLELQVVVLEGFREAFPNSFTRCKDERQSLGWGELRETARFDPKEIILVLITGAIRKPHHVQIRFALVVKPTRRQMAPWLCVVFFNEVIGACRNLQMRNKSPRSLPV